MGRHSAPETDEEGLGPPARRVPSAPPVAWTQPVPSAQPAPSPQPAPSVQPVLAAHPAPSPQPAPAAQPAPSEASAAVATAAAAGGPEPATVARAPKPAPAAGTRGDLQLLRSDTGLLLWCAGSVVLLFLVYTSVLILLGRTDLYLIWLWVPTVLSGMAIGGLLDRAHRVVAERDRPAP
ncbi:MAG TPA: hypothetical protein VFT67_08680 [Jatrophihabitantaceae bacterium]|nr:hypothetical protein [Jatrophihabitantaceae bacterium]